MAALSTRSRRRKIILVCAALGLGGYASYRVYNSSFVSCKRRRLTSFLGSLSRLAEAFALGIDSTYVVASDLRAFLFSDGDEVPRSLRQSLKIMSCKEFQDALTIFSLCVSRGVVGSIVEPGWNIDGGRRRNGSLQKQASDDKRADKGVHIVFENKEQVVIQSKDEKEKCVLTEETQSRSKKYSMNSTESSFQRQNQEGLPERLMEKLFTDAGKGFASAVLGSVARNTTLSFLEGLTKLNERPSTSECDSRGLAPDVCNVQGRIHEISSEGLPHAPDVRVDSLGGAATFLDLACSSKGRFLIAECIQAFVGTAVSVYLEKTRDVNFYEEMVAGMTTPAHQPAVKELLTSACSRAVETLVRTSHEVLSAGPAADSGVISGVPQKQSAIGTELGKGPLEELVNNLDSGKGNVRRYLSDSDPQGDGSSASSSKDDADSLLSSDCGSISSLESDVSLRLGSPTQPSESAKTMIVVTGNNGSSNISLPKWVEGVSKTLAVPSNRKLLIDVAGTVTSEAIHSFFEVFLGVVAPYLRGNFKYRCTTTTLDRRETRDVVEEEQVTGKHSSNSVMETFHNMQRRVLVVSREIVAKSLVAMTVCLAVIMHLLVDKVLEPV